MKNLVSLYLTMMPIGVAYSQSTDSATANTAGTVPEFGIIALLIGWLGMTFVMLKRRKG